MSSLQGIQAKLGNRVRVVTAEGVRLTDKGDWNVDEVVLADPQENRRRIAQAVQVAQGADAIVLALGGSAATSREAWADNHLGDTPSLELMGEQNELARALFALGKPLVVVLINGRPQAVAEIAARANTLLEGWCLGQEGGTALADILFGDANPGGRLPVTIPRSLDPSALALWDKNMRHVVEPGEFQVMVGPNSRDLQRASFVVTRS